MTNLDLKTSATAGVALSSAFYAEFISWRILIVVFIPVFFFLIKGQRGKFLNTPILIMGLIGGVHISFLFFSETPFWYSIIKESILLLLFILTVASVRDQKSMAQAVMLSITIVGTITAILGLLKQALQDRGILLGSLVEACPEYYPQGSSLCVDYNLMAATWLICAFGIISLWFRWASWWLLLLLPIVIAAGTLAGSRRFLLLMPVMVSSYWIILYYFSRRTRSFYREAFAAAFVLFGFLSLTFYVPHPEMAERYRTGAQDYHIFYLSSIFFRQDEGVLSQDEGVLGDQVKLSGNLLVRPPNRATPSVIAGAIDASAMNPRLVRWMLAYEIFKTSPFIGSGFNYHNLFLSEFSGRDYPHNPILTAALIGGAPFALLVTFLMANLFWRAVSASKDVQMTGIPVSFIALSAVCFISGDTIFSTPQWTALAVAMASQFDSG